MVDGVYGELNLEDYLTGKTAPVFVGSAADGDPLAQFEVFRPVNKYDGTLDGFEVSVQHLFDNNFGAEIKYLGVNRTGKTSTTITDVNVSIDVHTVRDESKLFGS